MSQIAMPKTAPPSTAADPVLDRRPENRVWKKFRAHRSAMFGGALVLFFILVALLAPVLPIPDPTTTDWGAVRKAPSAAHPFGTDEIGRDVLARMIWGAQASLLAGVVSVVIAVCLGVPLGIVAGYFGGWSGRDHIALHRGAAGGPVPDPCHRAGRIFRTLPDQCDDCDRYFGDPAFCPVDARAGLVCPGRRLR